MELRLNAEEGGSNSSVAPSDDRNTYTQRERESHSLIAVGRISCAVSIGASIVRSVAATTSDPNLHEIVMYVATVKRPLHSTLIASLSEEQQPNVCVCVCVCMCVPATNLRLSAGPLGAKMWTGLHLTSHWARMNAALECRWSFIRRNSRLSLCVCVCVCVRVCVRL